jgi:mannose-6-phosphate isomerase-like protein (cupin superfamily)
MLHIVHIPSVKRLPLEDIHGKDVLYQIFFEDYPEFDSVKPDSMKSFISFSRVLIKPSTTNEMHVHGDQEQIYFVLQGGGIIQVGEEKEHVKAGDAIFLPAKTPHGFVNNTDKLTILLMIGAKV